MTHLWTAETNYAWYIAEGQCLVTFLRNVGHDRRHLRLIAFLRPAHASLLFCLLSSNRDGIHMCFVVVLQHFNATYSIENDISSFSLRYHVSSSMIYESKWGYRYYETHVALSETILIIFFINFPTSSSKYNIEHNAINFWIVLCQWT